MQVDRETLRDIFLEIVRQSRAAVAPFTRGNKLDLSTPNSVGHVPPARGGTGHDEGAEPPLGDPPVDGYVLSSTTAGVRSWVPQSTGGGTTRWEVVSNADAAFPEVVFSADGDVVMAEVPA